MYIMATEHQFTCPAASKKTCCTNVYSDSLSTSKSNESVSNIPNNTILISPDMEDLLNSSEVTYITEYPSSQLQSTSAILDYCKKKILIPYLRLLGIMGLRPLIPDGGDLSCCLQLLNKLHILLVIVFMCIGYFLQYLGCFRRGRNHSFKMLKWHQEESSCSGSSVFNYLLPSLLHLSAYLYMVFLFRISENEQLQTLMERVCLQTSSSFGFQTQRHLLHTVRWFFILSTMWAVTAFAMHVLSVTFDAKLTFRWIRKDDNVTIASLACVMVGATTWQDIVQVTIITSYCLQCHLLSSYLHSMSGRVQQSAVGLNECIREIHEFRKLLQYMNGDLAPVIGILIILNLSQATSGIVWLLKTNAKDTANIISLIADVILIVLWTIVSLCPFIQAAQLSSACRSIQKLGHKIRVRPFGHQDTPQSDLDSFLLFVSSLKMDAKLFHVPIRAKILLLLVTISAFVILTYGQFIRK